MIKLHQLRLELFTSLGKRKGFLHSLLPQYQATYKNQIASNAYKEFVANQRRKGSYVEDVAATRGAQMEFERCQASAIRDYLVLVYSRSIMRALHTIFDKLVDERTGNLFNDTGSITLSRPYLVSGYPVDIGEMDYFQKLSFFDEFNHEIYVQSMKTSAPLLASAREKTRGSSDEKSTVVEVDTASHFIIRRDMLSQSVRQIFVIKIQEVYLILLIR
jgi:hypothetical protein